MIPNLSSSSLMSADRRSNHFRVPLITIGTRLGGIDDASRNVGDLASGA